MKFNKVKYYDRGYGWLISYELGDYTISKDSYNTWGITKNGVFKFAVPTLNVAKNYVEGCIKMGV